MKEGREREEVEGGGQILLFWERNDCGGYFLGKIRPWVVSTKPSSLAEKDLRCL